MQEVLAMTASHSTSIEVATSVQISLGNSGLSFSSQYIAMHAILWALEEQAVTGDVQSELNYSAHIQAMQGWHCQPRCTCLQNPTPRCHPNHFLKTSYTILAVTG